MLDSMVPTWDTMDRVADDTDPARAMPTPTVRSSSVIVRLLDAVLPWWALFAAPGVPASLLAGAPWFAAFLAASLVAAVGFYNAPWPSTHSDQSTTSST